MARVSSVTMIAGGPSRNHDRQMVSTASSAAGSLVCMLLIAALAIIWNVLGPRQAETDKGKTGRREPAPSPLIVLMKHIGVNRVNVDGLPTYIKLHGWGVQ